LDRLKLNQNLKNNSLAPGQRSLQLKGDPSDVSLSPAQRSMIANTGCDRDGGRRERGTANRCLIRRLARSSLLGFTAVVFATGCALGQDTSARRNAPDPPSLDELLKSLPSSRPRGLSDEEYRERHPTFRCESSKLSCDDPIALGALGMFARIRECWHPPAGMRMTTAVFFGQDAAQPLDPGAVTLAFALKADGRLSSRPHLSAPAALESAVNDLVRSVEHCQPYDMLPSRKYIEWKDVLMRIRIDQRPQQQPTHPIKGEPGSPEKLWLAPANASRG
jgi:hypothetical protein